MKSCCTVFIFLITLSLFGQNNLPFVSIAEQEVQLDEALEVALPLDTYLTFEVQKEALQASLTGVLLERHQNIKTASTEIILPLPEGSSRSFKIVESPVMQEELQARWPQLRTYRLLDANDHQFSGRMSVTPQGIQAVYQTAEGEVFLEPYAFGQDRYHVVYYEKDVVFTADQQQQLSCGYTFEDHEEQQQQNAIDKKKNISVAKSINGGGPVEIREYHLALTCTGEYAQNKGGTIESVLASFVTATNLVNVTFEREVGIRVILINQIEDIIFLYPSADPFINADEGGELLSQVRDAIVLSGGVLPAAYDMGHVFTAGCTDVGGVVSGGSRVCTGNKEEAVTCHYSNNISTIVRRVMTHEVAHHFTVGHTFSNCPGSEGQTAWDSAFEPGSGSTIMSYDGSCNNQNINGNNGGFYHSGSLEQFIFYTREGPGNTCPNIIETEGSQPMITLPYTDGFYIPISTPFELEGQATDMDNDPMTFTWEQMDLGFGSPLGSPANDAPLFRTYSPSSSKNRYFPRIQNIVNNQSDNKEVLPTYSRNLTFRFCVRDNNQEIGSTIWEDVAFRSTSSAGPFLVQEPNTSSTEWLVGEYREVRWDVANTDNELVNCQAVNIRLSTDGGFSYPVTLLTGAPNTGSAFVTVPDQVGTNIRIRVEAANNVFFDISNASFEIKEATQSTYTLDFNPILQQVCLPDEASVVFNTSSILGYDNPISLSLASELPEGMEASFNQIEIMPGEESQLSLDLIGLENFHGQLPITIAAAADGLDTFYRTLVLDVVDNEFSELALLSPEDGMTGISLITDFSWANVNNADSYDWQLSDDAAFNNILAEVEALEETDYTPNIQLGSNDLFYWRVRANNACGAAEWREAKVFHTVNILCSPATAEDTPISIPGTGTPPTRTSSLFVPFNGIISDIKVSEIDVSYQPIQNFRVTLIGPSPANTEVILYDQTCFSTDLVNIGFDDVAPDPIICPPNGQFSYQPVEPLSAFIGENTLGEWTLEVKVFETGFGAPGQIREWGIEFCAEGNAVAPDLFKNETLFVAPLNGRAVTNQFLEVTDNEQGPADLTYTVVTPVSNGEMYIAGQLATPGSTFTQADINSTNVNYLHTNSEATEDVFTFVVEDGTGGFLPVQRFNIVIDENAVATDDVIVGQNIRMFPNPARDKVLLEWNEPTKELSNVRVLNVHGQLIYENTLPKASQSSEIYLNDWPSGIYFVQLGTTVLRLMKQ